VPPPEDLVVEPVPRRKALRDDPVTVALRQPHRLLDPLEI
jgi:hypothetical protein